MMTVSCSLEVSGFKSLTENIELALQVGRN